MFKSLFFLGLSIWTGLYNAHKNVHLFHFLNKKTRSLPTMLTSEQSDKYAYCENENNQNVVFLPNSESFWIKFDLCLKISFHAKTTKANS